MTPKDQTSIEEQRKRKVRLVQDGNKFLSVRQVANLFSMGRMTLHWIKRDEHPFPRPMASGTRVTRFRVDQVEEWVEGVPEAGSLGALFGAEGDERDDQEQSVSRLICAPRLCRGASAV